MRVLLICALAFALAACGKKGAPMAPTLEPAEAEQPVE